MQVWDASLRLCVKTSQTSQDGNLHWRNSLCVWVGSRCTSVFNFGEKQPFQRLQFKWHDDPPWTDVASLWGLESVGVDWRNALSGVMGCHGFARKSGSPFHPLNQRKNLCSSMFQHFPLYLIAICKVHLHVQVTQIVMLGSSWFYIPQRYGAFLFFWPRKPPDPHEVPSEPPPKAATAPDPPAEKDGWPPHCAARHAVIWVRYGGGP